MKLSELTKKYLMQTQARRPLSRSTVEGYRSDLRRFCKFTGDIDSQDLTEEIFEEFYVSLKTRITPSGDPVRSATIHRYWKPVSGFCRWGMKKGFIPADTLPEIDLPAEDESRRVLITDTEVATILAGLSKIAHPQRRALCRATIQILSTSALRCSEVANLRMEDALLEQHQLHVVKGKGGKSRKVPINDKCVEAIRNWIALRPKQCKHTYLLAHDYWRRVSVYGIRQIVREAAHVAGFEGEQKEKFHPHTFRHNCAMRFYINTKFDIEATRKFLGHSKITTTQVYLDVDAFHLHNLREYTALDETLLALPDLTLSPAPEVVSPEIVAAISSAEPADLEESENSEIERMVRMMVKMMIKEIKKG